MLASRGQQGVQDATRMLANDGNERVVSGALPCTSGTWPDLS